MLLIANVVLVIGFCVATIGAAGFSEPPAERAWLYFGVGMAITALGGYLHRTQKKQLAHSSSSAGGATADFRKQIETVRDIVVSIDSDKGQRRPAETRDRIDNLLRTEFFDLTSRNEDWISVLGFAKYSQVWDGVAIGERILSRSWSMITDGYTDEGFAELPLARAQLERAATECAQLD